MNRVKKIVLVFGILIAGIILLHTASNAVSETAPIKVINDSITDALSQNVGKDIEWNLEPIVLRNSIIRTGISDKTPNSRQ